MVPAIDKLFRSILELHQTSSDWLSVKWPITSHDQSVRMFHFASKVHFGSHYDVLFNGTDRRKIECRWSEEHFASSELDRVIQNGPWRLVVQGHRRMHLYVSNFLKKKVG